MKPLTFLVVFALLTAAGSAGAQESPADPVERALLEAPATGLVILNVQPGSQAASKAIQRGDILTHYDGKETGTLAALRAALQGASDKTEIECTVLKADGTRVIHKVQPGALGLAGLVPVAKSKPAAPLPAAVPVKLDTGWLGEAPTDEWRRFRFQDNPAGFEHAVVSRLADGTLTVRSEVCFDGGAQWGVNHFDVSASVRPGERGWSPAHASFLNARNGWLGEGRLEERDGSRTWAVQWHHSADNVERRSEPLPTDLPAIPSYLVATFARSLPFEKGACMHLRVLNEGMGQVGLPEALYVAGLEKIDLSGEEEQAWRVEQHQLGSGVVSIYWIDAKRRAVRIDHGGGAVTEIATKADALSFVPEGVTPRTAGD